MAIDGIKSLPMAREAPAIEEQRDLKEVKGYFFDALQRAISATPTAISASESRHVPFAGSKPRSEDFEERALGIRAYRQQLIASNIANADTPNYKAVDINVRESMENILYEMRSQLMLAMTASEHIPMQNPVVYGTPPVKYHIPGQSSLDGNTVEMDVERAKFAENAVMYEFSLNRVKEEYKDMFELLTNLK